MRCMKIYVTLVFAILAGIFSTQAFAGEVIKTEKVRAAPDGEWQCEAAFPDWKGYVDDTLALNSMVSFDGWHGQGYFYVTLHEDTESLRLFVNGCEADVSFMRGGESCRVDFSAVAKDGKNTIQVTGFLINEPTLYHAITFVLLATSQSLCAQVMSGNSTKKVRIRKITSKAIRLFIFSLRSPNGRSMLLNQLTIPFIFVFLIHPAVFNCAACNRN